MSIKTSMQEPVATSLGDLSEHDWHVVQSAWAHGWDHVVGKIGKRHWQILGVVGRGFPLFRTKTAAYEVGSALVRAESLHRYWVRNANIGEG